MTKYVAALFLIGCIFLSSCAAPAKVEVKNVLDLKKEIDANNIVIVTDAAKRFYGDKFPKAFTGRLLEQTQFSNKKICLLTYIEFVRSEYNRPKRKNDFSNYVFVFIRSYGSDNTGPYGITKYINYVMEVKFLDQEPFLLQQLALYPGSGEKETGNELANTVFRELNQRNLF